MADALYVTTKCFCKRAWMGALLAVCTLVLGPLVIRTVAWLQGDAFHYIDDDLISIHFSYLFFSWAIFLTVCYQGLQGTKKLTFGLPISSTSIASWMMLVTVCLVVVLQLVTNGAYRVLFFDENWLADYWPLLGPLLFITMMILVGHSFYWSMHAPGIMQLFCWMSLFIGLFCWFITRYYPNGLQEKIVPWNHVALSEIVSMLLVCLAAWYQGTRAFGKVRNGTATPSLQWQKVQAWCNDLSTGTIFKNQTILISQRSSLTRLHWRDSCRRALLIGGVLFGIIVLTLNLLFVAQFQTIPSSLRDVVEGFVVNTVLFSALASVIISVILGEGINGPGRTEMKGYLAIAPMSDHDLNLNLFRNLLKTVAWTFLFLQCAMLLSLAVTAMVKGPEIFRTLLIPNLLGRGILVIITLTAMGFWTITANFISFYWTGRTWFYYTVLGVLFGCFGLYIAIVNIIEQYFSSQAGVYLLSGVFLSMSLLILGGTVTAYVVACRKKLMNISMAVIVLLLWLIGASLGFYFNYEPPQRFTHVAEPFLLFFFISLFSLAVTPFATIPLALSWNRHR